MKRRDGMLAWREPGDHQFQIALARGVAHIHAVVGQRRVGVDPAFPHVPLQTPGGGAKCERHVAELLRGAGRIVIHAPVFAGAAEHVAAVVVGVDVYAQCGMS